MISLRILSAAFVASSLCMTAPAYAYITPDEFIENGGGAPEEGAGDAANAPLPTLTPPVAPAPTPPPSPAPQPSPSHPQKKGGGGAPVLQLLPEERKKKEEVPVPSWETGEEERMELRMNAAHSAAPEAPHDAADSLPSSGLPFGALLIGTLFGGIALLHRKKVAFLYRRSRDS